MDEFLIDAAKFASKLGYLALLPITTVFFREVLGENVSGADIRMCISIGSYGLFLLMVSLTFRILYYRYLINKELNNGLRID